jgi:hypothetical protein
MDEAIKLLRQVETESFDSALGAAAAGLAMAYHKRGNTEAAKAHLKHARTLIEPHWPSGPVIPRSWHDFFFAHLLVDEAEALIFGTQTGG